MDFSKTVKIRRSYRSLDKIKIDENIIKQIADTIKLSPSCYNNQPWRFIFVYEENILEKVKNCLSEGNAWARYASMIIVVISHIDFDCKIKDGRNYYLFDTGISVGFLLLKAAELGLVAHPIAGYNQRQVKEALNIPEEMEVINLIIVSKHSSTINPILKEYQIESEKKRPERKKNEEFIFINKYL